MKSFLPAQWEKLAVEKGEVETEHDSLNTKILFEKRGEKRKLTTLRDLIKKGTFLSKIRKPQRVNQSPMRVLRSVYPLHFSFEKVRRGEPC